MVRQKLLFSIAVSERDSCMQYGWILRNAIPAAVSPQFVGVWEPFSRRCYNGASEIGRRTG